MQIRPINDGNSDISLVVIKSTVKGIAATPHCKLHGAMNKVSRFTDGGGYWRCTVWEGLCRAGCEADKTEQI